MSHLFAKFHQQPPQNTDHPGCVSVTQQTAQYDGRHTDGNRPPCTSLEARIIIVRTGECGTSEGAGGQAAAGCRPRRPSCQSIENIWVRCKDTAATTGCQSECKNSANGTTSSSKTLGRTGEALLCRPPISIISPALPKASVLLGSVDRWRIPKPLSQKSSLRLAHHLLESSVMTERDRSHWRCWNSFIRCASIVYALCSRHYTLATSPSPLNKCKATVP